MRPTMKSMAPPAPLHGEMGPTSPRFRVGRQLVSAVLLASLAACSDKPLPVLAPSPGPEDQAAPSADRPYRPVMAGTVWHSVGDRP